MKNYLKFTGEVDNYGLLSDIHLAVQASLGPDEDAFTLSKIPYVPKLGDKMFFLPGVNVPRIKLKDFAIQYNTKTTRDIEEATVIFGNKLSLSKVVDREWLYTVQTEHFRNCFEALKELGRLDSQVVQRVEDALEFYTEDIIITDYRSAGMMGDDELYKQLIVNPAYQFNATKRSMYTNAIDLEYLDLVESLEGKVVIDESALISMINGDDAVLINKEVYEQLCTMMDSSDTDNHVVAMEIISNCRYRESLFYMLKLFRRYHNKFRNCVSVNHVNFKSLLSYIGIDKFNMGLNMDKMIAKLMEKDVLTPGMLNAIIRDDIETGYFNSNMLQIKVVTANPEILSYLNKNYTYELIPDFVPLEKVEEAPVVQQSSTTWI